MFSINGRFFEQKLTGVQRYALEITKQIDQIIGDGSESAGCVITSNSARVPNFLGLRKVSGGKKAGVLWEQWQLPARASGPLLCFGNTGPVFYRNKIVCVHDANFHLEAGSYSRKFRLYMSAMVPLVSRTSLCITTVSAHSAEVLRALGVSRDREIVIAPNGHEHVLSWDSSRATLADANRFARPFVLLVGSLASHKNWKTIAKIAPELNDAGIDVVAVGAGGSEFEKLDDDGFSHIRMLGRISDNDLAWLYENALCLAFPSLVEGFGLPLIEAMALECPVVSANVSSMPSIGGDAVILLDPLNSRDWLAVLKNLKNNPDLRADLIERGTRRARMFCWRKSAEVYLNLISTQVRCVNQSYMNRGWQSR